MNQNHLKNFKISKPPSNNININNHNIYFIIEYRYDESEKLDWDGARKKCESYDMVLATPRSLTDNTQLANIILAKNIEEVYPAQSNFKFELVPIWIGYKKVNNYWVDTNGRFMGSFKYWGKGQPSREYRGIAENCVEILPEQKRKRKIFRGFTYWWTYNWNDVSCEKIPKSFVCKSP